MVPEGSDVTACGQWLQRCDKRGGVVKSACPKVVLTASCYMTRPQEAVSGRCDVVGGACVVIASSLELHSPEVFILA